MNIAFLVPALKNKGPVIVVKDLATYFTQHGHNCTVFYFDEEIELEMPCGVKKISFSDRREWTGFDILHVHCLRPALYVFLNKKQMSGVKIISTLHQPVNYKTHRLVHGRCKSVLLAIIEPFLQNRIECNVVLSQVQYELVKKYISTQLVVIENGRNVVSGKINNESNLQLIEELKSRYRIIGVISVVIKRKGIEQVIKALKYLPDYIVVCVGNGLELENLKDLSIKEGVNERCFWFGYQPDAVNYYKYFDVYALTSRSEGFPLSLIEAASQSTSCVLSNIDILSKIIPSDCASFFNLDDINGLVKAIENAYLNRERLQSNLYSYYKDNLTADVMGSKYLQLFNQLLNQ